MTHRAPCGATVTDQADHGREETKHAPARGLATDAGTLTTDLDNRRDRMVLLIVAAAMVVLIAYQAYRWPLGINSAATSPTYSDTPFALQATKYVLLALLGTLLLIAMRRRVADALSVSLAVLCAYLVLRTAFYPDWSVALDFAAPIVVTLPFVLAPIPLPVWSRVLRVSVVAFVYVNTVAIVVQVVAYAGWDRVPALSYRGGLLRFGGLWDDPNSSGIASALIIVALASGALRFPLRTKTILIALAAVAVVLSVSLSAVLALVVGLAYLVRRWWVRVALLASSAAAAALFLWGGVNPSIQSRVGEILDSKRSSALGRLQNTWPATDFPVSIVGDPSLGGSIENTMSGTAALFGWIGLALLAFWMLIVWRDTGRTMRAVLIAAFGAAMAVPILTTFPLGTILIVAACLAARDHQAVADPATAQPPRWVREIPRPGKKTRAPDA